MTQEILGFLRDQERPMIALLTELAALESPTDDPLASARVLDRLTGELAQSGMTVRRLRGRQSAGLLVARPSFRVRHKPLQLLVIRCWL